MKINIETKFNIGDKVFVQEKRIDFMLIYKCEKCDGMGKIETKGGIRKCPSCDGRKGKYKGVDFYYMEEMTIKNVTIYTGEDCDVDMEIVYDGRDSDNCCIEVDEVDIFDSEEGCRLYINISNAKEGWTDELLKSRDIYEEEL